jgi:hypothetical protein
MGQGGHDLLCNYTIFIFSLIVHYLCVLGKIELLIVSHFFPFYFLKIIVKS